MGKICIECLNENSHEMMKKLQDSGGTEICSRRLGVDTSIINAKVPRLVGIQTWCRTKFQKGTRVYFSI